MTKLKIKRDDVVVVTAGRNKGKVGKVLRVLPDHVDPSSGGRVVIEKVNLVKRAVKPQGDRAGGIVEKEASVHVSNVALWNASENRAVRVGYKILADGSKVRVDRKTGAEIDKA